MINLKIEKFSANKVLVDMDTINELINLAQKVDKINIVEEKENLSTQDLMKLTEQSNALDFLNNPEEDIYSIEDLKVKYK